MTITVVYTTQLKAALGVSQEQIELGTPCNLATLLDALRQRHASVFSELVSDAKGRLLPSMIICVDDEQIDASSETVIQAGSTVTFLSAISGG